MITKTGLKVSVNSLEIGEKLEYELVGSITQNNIAKLVAFLNNDTEKKFVIEVELKNRIIEIFRVK